MAVENNDDDSANGKTPSMDLKVPINNPKPGKKNTTAAVAVLIAILIALALVGLGYAAYRASGADIDLRGEGEISQEEEGATESADGESPASAYDVEQEIEAINEAMDGISQEDMDDESFEDEALGL